MNILITGKNGFLAKELIDYFEKDKQHNIIARNKHQLPLLDKKKVNQWFEWNAGKIDAVIHAAAIGGDRQVEDGTDVFFDTIEMFRNVYDNCIKYNLLLFKFTSGAEDYFGYLGYAKKAISLFCDEIENNIINLKIWNCFGKFGKDTRFIEGNIDNYINDKKIIIHNDILFDFFYSEDIYKIIRHFINNYIYDGKVKTEKVNCVYTDTTLLSEVAKIINNLDSKKVEVEVYSKNDKKDYVSVRDGKLENKKISFIGLKEGIRKVYKINQLS